MNGASTYLRINGTSEGPGNPGSLSIKSLVLGRQRWEEGYVNVRYCEVLVFGSVLSASDKEKLEGYLAWKWNMQSKLPSNHPYKNERPYL
jgi:hypothetical protein